MRLTAVYHCPVRGLARLDPPDPRPLGLAGRVARELGLEGFLFPVLEEALIRPTKTKVGYLDGLVRA
ncbi:MAG: hypothetical protein JW821_19580, partial [Deltaproteobacteria bacterium]|nr:hypothetical protein [Deltaproteobacteria bacterium]